MIAVEVRQVLEGLLRHALGPEYLKYPKQNYEIECSLIIIIKDTYSYLALSCCHDSISCLVYSMVYPPVITHGELAGGQGVGGHLLE